MVRAPCCEKIGVKKGPWTREEDQLLIGYVTNYGHPNWRSLPKLAGMQRCGKSCRLRWINYLPPDIKRGNFSQEEEEAIIRLHHMLGNRWSKIAAKLPGRTDNEIKNVWHTHLKIKIKTYHHLHHQDSESSSSTKKPKLEYSNSIDQAPVSPQLSSTELSSVSSAVEKDEAEIEINDFFFNQEFSSDNYIQVLNTLISDNILESYNLKNSLRRNNDEMEFWYDLFMRAEESPELAGF